MYGPPTKFLQNNGRQFAFHFNIDVYCIFSNCNCFCTIYRPQSSRKVDNMNRSFVAVIRHFYADHPKDWDEFSNALTYANNMSLCSSTTLAPFESVLVAITIIVCEPHFIEKLISENWLPQVEPTVAIIDWDRQTANLLCSSTIKILVLSPKFALFTLVSALATPIIFGSILPVRLTPNISKRQLLEKSCHCCG